MDGGDPYTRLDMQKITPCLWFDGKAEEAAQHYVSIFKDSRITRITRWGEVGPGPKGSVLTVLFQLEGQAFMALNGGPEFKFTPAISLMVDCKTQSEVDTLWDKLSEGGEQVQCGWVTDKFGVSWQVVPTILAEMIGDKDPKRADRVMAAMMQMKKLDFAKLQAAYEDR
jgi:predicted 3-demethylubiquinone-9 3-methyltransferase (glyoxalase superfamily)